MGIKFWVVRFAKVFIGAGILLFVVQLLKGYDALAALSFAAIWAFIATSIFGGSRVYQARKGIACELCDDMPEE